MNYHLKLAITLTRLLDTQFQIFKFKFGLDPILGLIPWVGDIFPFILSMYVIWIAAQYNLPQSKINQMIFNIVIDFLIGLVPVLGDLLDFFIKSNTKNMDILLNHLNNHKIIDPDSIGVEGEIVAG